MFFRPRRRLLGVLLLAGLAAAVAALGMLDTISAAPQPAASAGPAVRPADRIDQLCEKKLASLNITPTGLCSDHVFLRRVYLDVIGTLPSPNEARKFLASSQPDKRARLIDSLLNRSEFVDYWSLKWGDLLRIKAEYPVRVWPKGSQAYYQYVRRCIAENKPYDQFVRELLTATGSNFRDGPVNFYRAVNSKDPQSFAESASLLFMGVRLSCARCHDHPQQKNWKLADNMGMAAFFGQVRFKATGEWKEEIVFIDPEARLADPKTNSPVAPKFLDGPTVQIKPGQDGREIFADWLISPQNPYFTRNIANRIWFWLLGRGIVHEPDDMRPSNPPSNPELLDFLAGELVRSKYDLKHIFRIVLNSRTYQRDSAAVAGKDADDNFARYVPRRLPAEVLLDAISHVTQTGETYSSIIPEPYTKLPNWRAILVADGSITSPFLELFGRPSRDTPLESDRDSRLSMRQTLFLLNSSDIERKISTSGRLARFVKDKVAPADMVEELYLAAFSRYPTMFEKRRLGTISNKRKVKKDVMTDLLWAILNSQEFVFNH